MIIPSRVPLYLICVVVAGALAACGGSSSVTGPEAAAPVLSAGSADSKLTSSGEVEFRGVVQSVGMDGLVVDGRTVSVVGGMTETLGRQNQPIPFSDFVVGSFVQVEGLPQPDGSVLATKVKLEDDDANDQNDAIEIEFRGVVESVGADSLVVDGRMVRVVGGMTELLGRQNQPIPFSELVVGSFVEVEGSPQPDGSVLAKKVKLEDDDDEDADDENEPPKVEFEATIQSLSPLTVGGTVVSTNGGTRILDDDNNPIPFSALAVGMRVEVEGWPQPDGSVLAKKIKIED